MEALTTYDELSEWCAATRRRLAATCLGVDANTTGVVDTEVVVGLANDLHKALKIIYEMMPSLEHELTKG